ncbi:hypothetical protein BA724_06125 [Domibacillus iocasae]|uniref:Uncharacterized protein n=1 Tax=Domibacillus iocasae TaxID=1714016 RepID=A0A1E7DP26_9BACI|nr:hypothetical protein BA724_06125 [Domibacillus iocasae]
MKMLFSLSGIVRAEEPVIVGVKYTIVAADDILLEAEAVLMIKFTPPDVSAHCFAARNSYVVYRKIVSFFYKKWK